MGKIMKKVTISDLSFAYQKKDYIIKNLNLELTAGKFWLITGPTGCGKSTFLKIIAGLYPKYAGQLNGRIDLHNLKQAMMFQNPSEQFTMSTPRQEIIFALENLQIDQTEYEDRLKKAVVFTQISRLLDQKITTLSGGEKQRVALAVLVAMDVDIFLLDEPFASVDPEARHFLIHKLGELRDQGKTILLSDHVFVDYQDICDGVLRFKDQQINLLDATEQNQLFKFSQHNKNVSFTLPNKDEQAAFYLENTKLIQNRTLLKQKKLQIMAGKSTLITGANGIGKTSLFKALTKMIPYSGSMLYHNDEISKLKTRKYLLHVAQIFQNADDQFLAVTVRDEINLSKKFRNTYFSDERIKHALQILDLDQHLDQIVYSLSGGQKKKLQILLMLISRQETLLIDEPLSGLDQESIKQVIELMLESQKQLHQTFLIISHQIDELTDLCSYRLIFDHQQLKYVSEVPHESEF